MKQTDVLLELAECCEKATGPDRQLDKTVARALDIAPLYKKRGSITATWPDFTASLDAAMTLVPEGHVWIVGNYDRSEDKRKGLAGVGLPGRYEDVKAATPALALTAASLKARALAGGRNG